MYPIEIYVHDTFERRPKGWFFINPTRKQKRCLKMTNNELCASANANAKKIIIKEMFELTKEQKGHVTQK